jgi:Cu2+-exporting ATPase
MQAVTKTRKICVHCGTPFLPTAQRPDFCCAGCQFVHDLIAKNGLGQFYELQEGGVQPVKSLVFQKRDYTWLAELAQPAEREPVASLRLDLQGLSCIGCVWLIERLFSRKAGALSVRADSTLGQIDLRWQPGVFDVVEFARELQSFGYLVGPSGKSDPANDRALIVRLGICGALAMNTMLFTLPSYLGMAADFAFAPLFQRLSLVLSTLSLLIGGSYFFGRTWRSIRQGVLHIDLPISIGLIAAWLGSVYAWSKAAHGFVYFDFVSTFVFLMLVGRWLQQKAVARNRNQLLAAQADPPPVRLASGERSPVSHLAAGITYVIEAGQTVPVRSRLESSAAVLGTEWINGESDAAIAPRGRIVPAGAMNCGQAAIELESLEAWSDSLLAKLLRVTPIGETRNATVERFIRTYIWIVVSVAIGGFATWWIATGALLPALQVLISVLVVSCPCASGVALPLCSDLAASRLRAAGVFIRNTGLWAKLDRVRKIIFDKTGTLTPATISLRNPEALDALTNDERTVLLTMVRDSVHPVSNCLREQLLANGTEAFHFGRAEETIGSGLTLIRAGVTWRLGRPEWCLAPRSTAQQAEAGAAIGDSVFIRNGQPLARFSFGEVARDDAGDEIAALRSRGCEIYILSGDRSSKVAAMASRLGLPREHCQGELSPEEKAARVRELDAHDTLYVGDGANDSLAFDVAWCTGTPAVDRGLLEQKADFYFLGRGLIGLRTLLRMAAVRRRTVRTVVTFAIAYNVLAIALCLAGKMSPLLAAILMPASSLLSLSIVLLLIQRFALADPN